MRIRVSIETRQQSECTTPAFALCLGARIETQ